MDNLDKLALVQVTDYASKNRGVAAGDVLSVRDIGPANAEIEFRSGRLLVVKHTAAQVVAKIDAVRNAILGRGVDLAVATKTAAYTVGADDYVLLADASGGAFTITLPPAAERPGRVVVVKKIDASGNAVTLDGDGSETIDGATTKALSAQWQTLMVQADGAAWFVLAAGATA